jgi:hypothetical protein
MELVGRRKVRKPVVLLVPSTVPPEPPGTNGWGDSADSTVKPVGRVPSVPLNEEKS